MSLETTSGENFWTIDPTNYDKILSGRYNRGYLKENDFGYRGEELVEGEPERIILWIPAAENTPEMENQNDLMNYHLARKRNAEVMRDEGIKVPDTEIIGAEISSGVAPFLVTPYIEHECWDQRRKFPGNDIHRNNPHRQRFSNPKRRELEANISRVLNDIDDEELVEQGRIINADQGIDAHNENWGLVDGDIVRLDLGEVPREGKVWDGMPYSGPREFYRDQRIDRDARQELEDLGINPALQLPEGFKGLMS